MPLELVLVLARPLSSPYEDELLVQAAHGLEDVLGDRVANDVVVVALAFLAQRERPAIPPSGGGRGDQNVTAMITATNPMTASGTNGAV